MWSSAVPSRVQTPLSLPSFPWYTFSLSSVHWCVCVCECMSLLICSAPPCARPCGMQLHLRFAAHMGASCPDLFLKVCTHKHKTAVTCTHRPPLRSAVMSEPHATYLHSGFKETVYKAVVDGDLARWSFFLLLWFSFIFLFVFFLFWGAHKEERLQLYKKA